MKFILGMAHNTTTDRWHPMVYRPDPLPGPGPHAVDRYKSLGHHTEGFDTREDADANQREASEKIRVWDGYSPQITDRIVAWNGTGLPIDVLLQPSGDGRG